MPPGSFICAKCRVPVAKTGHTSTDRRSDFCLTGAFSAASDKQDEEYSLLRTLPAKLAARIAILAGRKRLIPVAMRCRFGVVGAHGGASSLLYWCYPGTELTLGRGNLLRYQYCGA